MNKDHWIMCQLISSNQIVWDCQRGSIDVDICLSDVRCFLEAWVIIRNKVKRVKWVEEGGTVKEGKRVII